MRTQPYFMTNNLKQLSKEQRYLECLLILTNLAFHHCIHNSSHNFRNHVFYLLNGFALKQCTVIVITFNLLSHDQISSVSYRIAKLIKCIKPTIFKAHAPLHYTKLIRHDYMPSQIFIVTFVLYDSQDLHCNKHNFNYLVDSI